MPILAEKAYDDTRLSPVISRLNLENDESSDVVSIATLMAQRDQYNDPSQRHHGEGKESSNLDSLMSDEAEKLHHKDRVYGFVLTLCNLSLVGYLVFFVHHVFNNPHAVQALGSLNSVGT